MPDLTQFIGLVAIGFFVGTYGTLIGAGGGFLMVPLLIMFYGASAQQAVGTSLFVIFFNALSGSISYSRQKRIEYKTAIRFSFATLPGAILGALVTDVLQTKTFSLLFGGFLSLVAIYLFSRPDKQKNGSPDRLDSTLPKKRYVTRFLKDSLGNEYILRFHEPYGLLMSFLVGFLSSVLGIGGGLVHVPMMIYLFDFPAHIATATSHLILMFTSVFGAVSHIGLGHFMPGNAIALAAGVIPGAQFGAFLAQRTHSRWIIRLLTLALLLVAGRLIYVSL